MKRRSAWLVLAFLVCRLGTADTLVITEFMAINEDRIVDEDGEYRDWVEIYNYGEAPVDLEGWALTDDEEVLDKWKFPAGRSLAPGEFLVVFASGKWRDGEELHTNFKLSKGGEYLALVAPDGVTKTSEYTPEYPRQVPFASFGVEMGTSIGIVGTVTPARYLVPADDSVDATWTSMDFDDGAWKQGSTPLGYDRKSRETYSASIMTDVSEDLDRVNSTLYVRIPFEATGLTGLASLLLNVRYDDGFVAYLNGTEIARRNAPDTLNWESRADSTHSDVLGVIPEEIDVSEHVGLIREGENVLAFHALNRSSGNSDFFIAPELEGIIATDDLRIDKFAYLPNPSPGRLNGSGFPEISEDPEFERKSSAFAEDFGLVLSAAEGAEIRYTLDGSVPAEFSPLYSGPITIDGTTTVRARTYAAGKLASDIVSHTYMKLAPSIVQRSSNLPLVLVNTFGVRPSNNGQWVRGQIVVIDLDTDGRSKITSEAQFIGNCAVKVRGSSTGGRTKFSMNLEIRDEEGEDLDVELLGFPEESDYVLYGALNFDRALIRNPLMYELSNQVGRYAVRTKFIELFMNMNNQDLANGHYYGVYSFCERIKRGPDRVDIAPLPRDALEEPEVTGGYMMKIDRLDPGDRGFPGGGRTLGHVEPKETEIAPAQRAYISGYVTQMVNSLRTRNYEEFIDVGSWIDHHILNVLANNVDALRLSTYMFKDREGKYEYGPIWDFDRSINSTDGRDDNPRAWHGTGDATRFFEYPWWVDLFRHQEFMRAYQLRWKELRGGALSTENVDAVIDRMAAELTESQPREAARWNQTNHAGWLREIAAMKSWLAQRSAWIDSQFIIPPEFDRESGDVERGALLTITGDEGVIYYTTDGSDPRGPGSRPAESAIEYTEPVVIDRTMWVRARSLIGTRTWSDVTDGTYVVDPISIAITEFMYRPLGADPGKPFSRTDYEWIELLNTGTTPLDAVPLAFPGSPVRFSFAENSDVTTIAPGEYVVIARDTEAFIDRHGDAAKVVGNFETGSLSDSGETIELVYGDLTVIEFRYEDDWHPTTDGDGYSLTLVDPSTPVAQLEDAASWRASSAVGGSPGRPDGDAPTGGLQKPGDFSQDGKLSVTDPILLLRNLFSGQGTRPCATDAGNVALLDVNGDASLDVADAVFTLQYLFQRGDAPARGAACVMTVGCENACATP